MGKEHPYTLWALCHLSKIYIYEGELANAEITLVEGIAAGKRSGGEDHLGVLMGCGELARVYTRQGRLDEAEALSLRTIEKVRLSRGSEHPDYATGMWRLGHLSEKKQELTKAGNAYRIALEATGKRLTAGHPLYKLISDRIMFLTAGSPWDGCKQGDIANDGKKLALVRNYERRPRSTRPALSSYQDNPYRQTALPYRQQHSKPSQTPPQYPPPPYFLANAASPSSRLALTRPSIHSISSLCINSSSVSRASFFCGPLSPKSPCAGASPPFRPIKWPKRLRLVARPTLFRCGVPIHGVIVLGYQAVPGTGGQTWWKCTARESSWSEVRTW